ncbi:MAG: FAD-binding oxidoreductase [Cytophagales bacterium]|nr:FAD-binding oxidoreductase [Armatimonadota bacterium]
MPLDPQPLSVLSARLGAENIRTDDDARARASGSWSPLYTKAKLASTATTVDAVAVPGDPDEVAAVVQWAKEHQVSLTPVGGGSGITGKDDRDPARGLVAVDLSRLQTVRWDEESLLVHAGAGCVLGQLEEQLNAHDYTLGFMPQSLHLATVGGAAATNLVGLLSGRYGRLREIAAGLEVVLANGSLVRTQADPGAGAAFDLQDLLIGSEGTLGIITEVSLRMRPVPEVRAWAVFSFPTFSDASEALRLIYRSDARPAGVRLLDTEAAGQRLAAAGFYAPASLLLLAFEGDELVQTGPYQVAYAICQKIGGTPQASEIGENWFEEERSRTDWLAPNARAGGLADAFALSATWSTLKAVHDATQRAMAPLVTHLDAQITHAYPTGAALTIVFEAQAEPPTPEASVRLYERIVAAGLEAALESGGSIAHHYGVGRTRSGYFRRERGPAATAALQALKAALDPDGLLPPV